MMNIAKGVFASLAVAIIILKLPSFVFASIGSVQAEHEHSFYFSLQPDNCVSIDCVKEKIRLSCDKEPVERPVYIYCYNILRCLELSEQITMFCAGGYSQTIVKT